MIRVRLLDGSVLELPDGARPRDVCEALGKRLARDAVAARVNGQLSDLERELPSDGDVEVKILTAKDPEALDVMRHSAAHIMARAVMRVFPGVKLAFGPTIENGFYYDFELPTAIREEDLPRIEEEMRRVIQQQERFERFELPTAEARQFCNELGQSYKVEHIDGELKQYPTLSFYRQGEFVDLCRGPHVPDASRIGAFKLLSVAGAYWKNDSSRKMLQRVYGTAWFTSKDLAQYLHRLEEAKRRDHRVLGKQLELFTVSADVGSGLVLWMPKGAAVRGVLESFIKEELMRRGYQPVYTPHIGRVQLFRTSGHYTHYADKMYAPVEIEGDQYLLKPMNCPHHIHIYKARPHSYRELPVRLAEFGTVYRFEQSGELTGMMRVRGFTQDDAHIFCTPEQVESEFQATVELTQFVLDSLGIRDYRLVLSRHEEDSQKYPSDVPPKVWQQAEQNIRNVLERMGLNYQEARGEAAFYGPKADFLVRDCIGREWQLGTVQLDYVLPERFGLEYIGVDNRPHRPVMIHRAPLGSMERFLAILIEHFAGAFPLWLAPVQVRVLSISEKFADYTREVLARLQAAGFRAEADVRAEKIGHKIREAQLEKIPYMFIVGAREQAEGKVAVRDRIDGDVGAKPLAEAIALLKDEADGRRVRQTEQMEDAGWGESEVSHQY